MTRPLGTIVVDLTPVLPGGENGGAKVFTLELLRGLAAHAPATRFVLLTRQEAHEELAALDGPNIGRRLTLTAAGGEGSAPLLKRLLQRLLPLLPGRVRGLLKRAAYAAGSALKRRRASGALLRELGADLLFCPFTAPTYAEPGIPTVCTFYDLQHRAYPQFFAPEDAAHREHVFLDVCARADRIAAISGFTRQDVLEQTGLAPERVRAISLRLAGRLAPGAAGGTGDGSGDASILGRLGLAPGRYLLCPANFWKHKNHEMLLTAFALACRQGLPQDIRLVCTGAPGPRRDWLLRAASALGLDGRVLFPGYLATAELAGLMAACAGLVFPTLYEGFGLPVLEGMAAGVPVACSDAAVLREVGGDAVLSFDPRRPEELAAALVALATDGALGARLVAAGRERVREYADTGRMVREYWELFQDALAAAELSPGAREKLA